LKKLGEKNAASATRRQARFARDLGAKIPSPDLTNLDRGRDCGMKVNRTLLAIGLLVLLQAAAVGQSTNKNVSASSSKAQIKPVYPVVEYKLQTKKSGTEPKDKIVRYGGVSSSQAWTTIVTRRDNPTVFHDCSKHEPEFCLLSFGHKP
jgi:hypothetical protein